MCYHLETDSWLSYREFMKPAVILSALILASLAHAQDVHDTSALQAPSAQYAKSDCQGALVRPITETIVKAAEIEQVTENVSVRVQASHSLKVIVPPNYRWVTPATPSDIEEGYIHDPIPIYAYKFIPGTYEWQNGGIFELQPESFDTVIAPSGEQSQRRVASVMGVKRHWVQVSSGRVEKVITGYEQPPPAPKGAELISSSPPLSSTHHFPAVFTPQTIVIGQVRQPSIIQQSYGECIIKPKT